MKTTLKSILIIFFLVFALQSCEDNDDVEAPASLQVNDFIWRGLNEVYLWQGDVPNLADDRFGSDEARYSFLSGYSKPEDLFEDLLNKPESKYPNGNAVDRFSWIVDDYTVLEQQLNGISKNNGVDFQLTRVAAGSNDVVGYVRYIIPNSDASTKAIKRGDFFTSINGTKITVSNYQSLLSSDNYTLNLADYNGNTFVLNGKSVALTKTTLEENPILISKVITVGTYKIGYLMYNGFYSEYDTKLNEAFAALKNQGAKDLVLDLRYNGGGSVTSATRLASMITGISTDKVFSKREYNFKQMAALSADELKGLNEMFVTKFKDNNNTEITVSSLNLTKVYILTTGGTASASELIINGLKPYISVIQIGETTYGKNVGSFTVYDSPNLNKREVNPNHKYAMQPIVFKITNSVGFGDYTQGLESTYPIVDNPKTYGILGDTKEPLLELAISKITGIPISTTAKKDQKEEVSLPYVNDSKKLNGLRNEMYLQKAPQEFLKTLR